MINTKNRYFVSGNVATIEVYNKKLNLYFYVLVDSEDMDFIKDNAQSITLNVAGNTTEYALFRYKDKQLTTGLHRVLMNTPKHLQVDHINHNGLDNRKKNLRNCTAKENNANRRPSGDNTKETIKMYTKMKNDEVRAKFNWFNSKTS